MESLYGSDKLREAYPKINKNFNELNKETNDLRTRVNTIITTPIEGETAAQEVVDARNSAVKDKTFETLDARMEETEQDNDTITQELDAHKAETVTQSGGVHGLYLEEGVFTPRLTGSAGSNNHVYSKQIGRYQRIGNKVFITIEMEITQLDPNFRGTVNITELPFSVGEKMSALSIGYIGGINLSNFYFVSLAVYATLIRIFKYTQSVPNGGYIYYADFSAPFKILASGIIEL